MTLLLEPLKNDEQIIWCTHTLTQTILLVIIIPVWRLSHFIYLLPFGLSARLVSNQPIISW